MGDGRWDKYQVGDVGNGSATGNGKRRMSVGVIWDTIADCEDQDWNGTVRGVGVRMYGVETRDVGTYSGMWHDWLTGRQTVIDEVHVAHIAGCSWDRSGCRIENVGHHDVDLFERIDVDECCHDNAGDRRGCAPDIGSCDLSRETEVVGRDRYSGCSVAVVVDKE